MSERWRKRLLSALLMVATFLLAIGSGDCSPGVVYVHGRVVEAGTEAPVAGVSLILHYGGLARKKTTNASGQFVFGVRRMEYYELEVWTGEGWELAGIACPAHLDCREEGNMVHFSPPEKGEYTGDFVIYVQPSQPPAIPTITPMPTFSEPTPTETPTPGPYDFIPLSYGDKMSVLATAWQHVGGGLEDVMDVDDPTLIFGMGDMMFGLPRSKAFDMFLHDADTRVRCRAYTFGVIVYFPERKVGWPLPYTVVPWDFAFGGGNGQ